MNVHIHIYINLCDATIHCTMCSGKKYKKCTHKKCVRIWLHLIPTNSTRETFSMHVYNDKQGSRNSLPDFCS